MMPFLSSSMVVFESCQIALSYSALPESLCRIQAVTCSLCLLCTVCCCTLVRSLLQEYVKARLLQFVGEPVFAKRMYQTVEGVQRAAKEVLTEISVPAGNSSQDGATGAYSLQFRHDCRLYIARGAFTITALSCALNCLPCMSCCCYAWAC